MGFCAQISVKLTCIFSLLVVTFSSWPIPRYQLEKHSQMGFSYILVKTEKIPLLISETAIKNTKKRLKYWKNNKSFRLQVIFPIHTGRSWKPCLTIFFNFTVISKVSIHLYDDHPQIYMIIQIELRVVVLIRESDHFFHQLVFFLVWCVYISLMSALCSNSVEPARICSSDRLIKLLGQTSIIKLC